jgi:hypothetical protein
MHARIRLSLSAGTTLLALSAPVSAFNCYAIVDRSNDVVYQGVVSPVDLSDEGAPARAAMRARGQQLIAMDTENCPAIDRARVTGQGGPATVEEIVAGMRSAVPYGSAVQPSRDETVTSGGISLPRITVPRATGGGISPSGPPSGMSIR